MKPTTKATTIKEKLTFQKSKTCREAPYEWCTKDTHAFALNFSEWVSLSRTRDCYSNPSISLSIFCQSVCFLSEAHSVRIVQCCLLTSVLKLAADFSVFICINLCLCKAHSAVKRHLCLSFRVTQPHITSPVFFTMLPCRKTHFGREVQLEHSKAVVTFRSTLREYIHGRILNL